MAVIDHHVVESLRLLREAEAMRDRLIGKLSRYHVQPGAHRAAIGALRQQIDDVAFLLDKLRRGLPL